MAFLPRPVTMMMLVRPAATASSMTYWMIGLSTRGSISFGWALVAGRKRVPRPAAGNTAFRILVMSIGMLPQGFRQPAVAGVLSSARKGGCRAGSQVHRRESRAGHGEARDA